MRAKFINEGSVGLPLSPQVMQATYEFVKWDFYDEYYDRIIVSANELRLYLHFKSYKDNQIEQFISYFIERRKREEKNKKTKGT